MTGVSQEFLVNGATVWSPATTVARLFKEQAEAAAAVFGIETGIGAAAADEYVIDLPAFEQFLIFLVENHRGTGHPILQSLTSGLISTGMAIIERADGKLPQYYPELWSDWADSRNEHLRRMPT